jgi:hypothetical protein
MARAVDTSECGAKCQDTMPAAVSHDEESSLLWTDSRLPNINSGSFGSCLIIPSVDICIPIAESGYSGWGYSLFPRQGLCNLVISRQIMNMSVTRSTTPTDIQPVEAAEFQPLNAFRKYRSNRRDISDMFRLQNTHLFIHPQAETEKLKNSMKLSPSSQATVAQSFKNLPAFYATPKVHCRVHNSSPLIPLLSQIDPVYNTPFYLLKISHETPIWIPLLPICDTSF